MNLTYNERRGKYTMEIDLPIVATVLTKGKKIARFELDYFKGERARGIHVWMRVLEVEQHDGYTSETFELFGGKNISTYLKALPRKNDKALALAASKIDALVPELLAVFVDDSKTKEDVRALLVKMSEVIA